MAKKTKRKLHPKEDEAEREVVVRAITEMIADRFGTFGGGRPPTPGNPVSAALKDRPLVFAAGVDVADVVQFVLQLRD